MATPPSVIAVAKNSGRAGNLLFGLPDVRDDQLGRLHRARALTPASASDALISFRNERRPTGSMPLRRVLRKLAVQVLLELGRLGHRLEAAPVPAARRLREPRADRLMSMDVRHRAVRLVIALVCVHHRWHTEQLVMCSTPAILYSFTRRGAELRLIATAG